MNEILSYTICLFVIILGITSSVENTLKRRTVSFSLEKVLYYFSILISILLIALKIDIILEGITRIATVNFNLNGIYNDICKIILLVVLFFLIEAILYKVLKLSLMPIFFTMIPPRNPPITVAINPKQLTTIAISSNENPSSM